MTNPFRYGGVVSADAFCNRRSELSDLRRAIDNSERMFLYSERRLGKTSLIQLLLSRLPKRDYLTIYVDLWPTDGLPSFATTVAEAIALSTSTKSDKLLETAKEMFAPLSPSLTLDSSGNPSLKFGIVRSMPKQIDIQEILNVPGKLSQKMNRKVVVVFDEFRRLIEYENDLVERTLRSVVQTEENVAWLLLGSRKHLIQRMFLDQERPLYRSAGHYPLGMIGTEHWLPFIRERFLKANKEIEDEVILSLCELSEGHPFYTQHLAHALWELTPFNDDATPTLLNEALSLLLQRESYAFTTLWESLTRNHQRFLRGLALEAKGVAPFSSGFIARYGLRSASNAQRAAETLLERDVVDRENGSFTITDRFLRLWIQRTAE